MIKNNVKEINFFEPKIITDNNQKFEILKKNIITTCTKIYGIIFILSVLIVSLNTLITSIKFKIIKTNVSKTQEENLANSKLKEVLIEQQKISQFLNTFLEDKENYTTFIETLNNLKPSDTKINELIIKENFIHIKCISKDSNSAIKYVKKIRENEKFLEVLYNGGNYLGNENFEFELNIKI